MSADKPKRWTVMRWSGRNGDAPRVRFIGAEEMARAIYAKLHEDMHQGGLQLFDGEGNTVLRDWAPRLRTRW
jgi:hypothetical protein